MKKTVLFLLVLTIFYTGNATEQLLHNPVKPFASGQAFISFQQFFKSYDTAVLHRLIKPVIETDEPARLSNADIEYMRAKNIQLMPMLNNIRPGVYNVSVMNPDDEMLVYAGLIECYYEMGGNLTQRAAFPWTCIKDVILSAFNVSTLLNMFADMIASGATWSTLRPFLWQSLRRYGGWFTVASIVYTIATQCF